jgi:hypothetical protein
MFEISGNRVTAIVGKTVYTVERRADGFRAWCVNASSIAWSRGFARTHTFRTAAEVEAKYKRLAGIASVLDGNFPSMPAGVQ